MNKLIGLGVTLVGVWVTGLGVAQSEIFTATSLTLLQPENPSGCVETYDVTVDYFPDKVEALHARSWNVSYADNYKVVNTFTNVASVHAGSDAEVRPQTYVLVQCGTPVPALEGDLADATVIEIPIATAVDGDDVLFESFEFFGVADGLLGSGGAGLSTVEEPFLPTVFARQESGEMVTLGYETNLEVLTALEPDIYIKSSGEEETLAEVADTLNIPVVIYNPYQESPLGAAEKLKFLALFYNQEAVANAHLEPAIARYLELRDLAQAEASTPSVLIGFVRNGAWSTRQNERYEMLLVEDAGGQRVLDLPGNGFTSVDLETAVEEGIEADFWFNLAWQPSQETIAEFIDAAPELAAFEAVQQGNAFHRFGARGIDYSYNATINPDVLLADIISILHPTLLPEHEIVYLQPIARASDAPNANLQGCVEGYDPAVDYFPDEVNADYAEDWRVTYFNHYKVVTVGPVGDAAAGDTETYVLVQCGTPVPELTGDLAGAYVVEIPIETLFETSGGGSIVTGLEVLGEADTLIGLGYVPIGEIDLYIPDVAEQIQRDDFLIVNVSEGGFEPVVAAEPDLFIEPYNAERRAAARELDIPAMFYNSFWETPLGGAEHIKFWSLLFNKEAVANERFAPIAADYLALKAQVAQAVASDERPLVLHGQVTKDNTFSTFGPGRIDYHLTEDAGGRPLLVELDLVNDAFTSLALEDVIEVAVDANFWWNSTYYADERFGSSISALLADNPLNGALPPAEEGTTFHIFGRGEDLYKTAYNYRADLILKDLVSILHPELLPDHEPLWMVPINEE